MNMVIRFLHLCKISIQHILHHSPRQPYLHSSAAPSIANNTVTRKSKEVVDKDTRDSIFLLIANEGIISGNEYVQLMIKNVRQRKNLLHTFLWSTDPFSIVPLLVFKCETMLVYTNSHMLLIFIPKHIFEVQTCLGFTFFKLNEKFHDNIRPCIIEGHSWRSLWPYLVYGSVCLS